jgi:hypothetical protein
MKVMQNAEGKERYELGGSTFFPLYPKISKERKLGASELCGRSAKAVKAN